MQNPISVIGHTGFKTDCVKRQRLLCHLVLTPKHWRSRFVHRIISVQAVWSFRDDFCVRDVFPFVFRTALAAAAKKTTLHETDVLPEDLVPICSRISKDLTGKAFRDQTKQRLSEHIRRARNEL